MGGPLDRHTIEVYKDMDFFEAPIGIEVTILTKEFDGTPTEYRARLYTTGKEVRFVKLKLTAVRVYAPLYMYSLRNSDSDDSNALHPWSIPDSFNNRSEVINATNFKKNKWAVYNLSKIKNPVLSKKTGWAINGVSYDWNPRKDGSSLKISINKKCNAVKRLVTDNCRKRIALQEIVIKFGGVSYKGNERANHILSTGAVSSFSNATYISDDPLGRERLACNCKDFHTV